MDKDIHAVEAYALEQLKAYVLDNSAITVWKRSERRRVVYALAKKIADQFYKPDLVDRLEFVMHEYIDDLLWDAKNIH